MNVTDSMVETASEAFDEMGGSHVWRKAMRAALEAVIVDIPELVLGPFVLSYAEEKLVSFFEDVENYVGGSQVKECAAIVRRAQRTLAAPAIEPLSEEEELHVSNAEEDSEDDPREAHAAALCAIIRKRLPKPAPKQRTAEELISFLRQEVSGRAGVSQALDQLSELVALAKRGEK